MLETASLQVTANSKSKQVEVPDAESFLQTSHRLTVGQKCAADATKIASEQECQQNCTDGCFGTTKGGHALWCAHKDPEFASNAVATKGCGQFPCLCWH